MNFNKKMYIAGELVDGQGVIELFNPATETKVASLPSAGVDDADRALHAAQAALPGWSSTSIAERQAWMRKLRDAVIANEEQLRDCIYHDMIPFDDHTDLDRMANDCDEGGLTAYVFTKDLARAERWAATLRYGEVQINGVKYDIDLPHGGIGQSGIGHDCSYLALNDYLIIKRISRALHAA